jgi:DNA primase large subunit
MDEDDRLMPVLNNINKQYLGREFTTSAIAGEIQAGDIDSVSFPFFSGPFSIALRLDNRR